MQLWVHLDSEGHLRAKGRSRAWVGKEKYGSVGMLRGEMKECFNDHLEDQSISIVKVWWCVWVWGGGT